MGSLAVISLLGHYLIVNEFVVICGQISGAIRLGPNVTFDIFRLRAKGQFSVALCVILVKR